MENYEELYFEVVVFSQNDIVTASGDVDLPDV